MNLNCLIKIHHSVVLTFLGLIMLVPAQSQSIKAVYVLEAQYVYSGSSVRPSFPDHDSAFTPINKDPASLHQSTLLADATSTNLWLDFFQLFFSFPGFLILVFPPLWYWIKGVPYGISRTLKK